MSAKRGVMERGRDGGSWNDRIAGQAELRVRFGRLASRPSGTGSKNEEACHLKIYVWPRFSNLFRGE